MKQVPQAEFWDKSEFNRSCPSRLLNFCQDGTMRYVHIHIQKNNVFVMPLLLFLLITANTLYAYSIIDFICNEKSNFDTFFR